MNKIMHGTMCKCGHKFEAHHTVYFRKRPCNYVSLVDGLCECDNFRDATLIPNKKGVKDV